MSERDEQAAEIEPSDAPKVDLRPVWVPQVRTPVGHPGAASGASRTGHVTLHRERAPFEARLLGAPE